MLELRCRCEGHAVDSRSLLGNGEVELYTLVCALHFPWCAYRFTWCVSLGVCSCPDAWMEEAAAAGPADPPAPSWARSPDYDALNTYSWAWSLRCFTQAGAPVEVTQTDNQPTLRPLGDGSADCSAGSAATSRTRSGSLALRRNRAGR